MERISIFLPGHPFGKGRHKASVSAGGHLHIYPDAKTVAEEYNFLALARPYLPRSPLKGTLRLEMTAVILPPRSLKKKQRELLAVGMLFPTRKPDVDNLAKLAMDAMNGRFYLDDAQVQELIVRKVYGEVPGIQLTLEEIAPSVWSDYNI